MKTAILSMDIEDWYHLDYFDQAACDRTHSLLDGVERYREILQEHDILSSFFVLGELVKPLRDSLRELDAAGHDIASHGWAHERPLTMTTKEFASDLERSRKSLEDTIGAAIKGYRAPCFSMDRERLEQVRAVGFEYDSSRILFGEHPLYGTVDMSGFCELSPNIFRQDSFFEFQVSTHKVLGRNIPISGGGYIRIFPWMLMRRLIKSYLKHNDLYVLYIHPFELSPQPSPPVPEGTSRAVRSRFAFGRPKVAAKLNSLIHLLEQQGFRFTTFARLREELLRESEGALQDA